MFMSAGTSAVFVIFDHAMNAQIDAYSDEKYRADMSEPFLESVNFLRQVADADRAVTNQPCYKHDRQTSAETEDERHDPVPCARECQRDINHRQEINQSVRTESDGEEDTEDERPQPTGVRIGVLQELAYSVIVLMVMMSAEKQHNTAYKHECGQDRFAPVRQNMLYACCLCAHEERYAEQHIRRQFAENEHESVAEHLALVVNLFIDITDGRNTRD